ncbi:hypothetical protein K439DRAFT_1632099 [Ramaria rubella]|nr:hypothetical protein K439DRAFT_1632099 [Ramaria rubella]
MEPTFSSAPGPSPTSSPRPEHATPTLPNIHSPFNSITENLRNRIIDWKGNSLADLGHFQMFDVLSIRRDSVVREFYVYLFTEAIICVIGEKKRYLGRKSETNVAGEFGLTIDMQGKGFESFILIFKDRSSLEIWRRHISDSRDRAIPPYPASSTALQEAHNAADSLVMKKA